MTTSHECPAAGCTAICGYNMLMCGQHWRMVPGVIRASVWNAWQDGAGAGTPQHTAAINAAIRAVNEKLAAKSTGRSDAS